MNNGPDKINDLNTLSSVNQDISVIRNNSKMKYSVLSAQGDLTLPYKWINIDAGIKYTLLDNKSDIGYYDFDGTDYILNPNNSNVFRYKEHNYAIYVGDRRISIKWSAKVGLRYEYTSLGRGVSARQEVITVKFFQLPMLALNQMIIIRLPSTIPKELIVRTFSL